jgi:hypothetical protein
MFSTTKTRRELNYETFVKAFQAGSLATFTSDNPPPPVDPKDRSMKRHGSIAGLPLSIQAPAPTGALLFTLYDEDNGSINAHNLHTYYDYKNLFFNEVVTHVMKAFPKETNVQTRIHNQVVLLCELASLNPRFSPPSLEEDYAIFLTKNTSSSNAEILDQYNSLSILKKQEILELFDDSHTRRGTTWISILQRLLSLECVHLSLPFLRVSLQDERFRPRFLEFITPERLNCPTADGIPLIYKLLWAEKRSPVLLNELIKHGLAVDGSITAPSETLSSTILTTIRNTAIAANDQSGPHHLGSGGLFRTNSGLGLGQPPPRGSISHQFSTEIASVPTTQSAKVGDSSLFFRRGSQATLPTLPTAPVQPITLSAPLIEADPSVEYSSFPRVESQPPPPPPPTFDDSSFQKSSSHIPPPPPPPHPYPSPSALPDYILGPQQRQDLEELYWKENGMEQYWFKSGQNNTNEGNNNNNTTPNIINNNSNPSWLLNPTSTHTTSRNMSSTFTFAPYNLNSHVPAPPAPALSSHSGHAGSTYGGSLSLEDLLILPNAANIGLNLTPFSTKTHQIASREIMLYYFQHIIKARYPVMQNLLHVLFDINPISKFSPFYNLSDFFQSPDPNSKNHNNNHHYPQSNLIPSASNFRGGVEHINPSDFDFGLRDSTTLMSAAVVGSQKYNPTSFYTSQHSISPDNLPAVPQIPFPRPPLPSSDIDFTESLQPSLEMVQTVFNLTLQNFDKQYAENFNSHNFHYDKYNNSHHSSLPLLPPPQQQQQQQQTLTLQERYDRILSWRDEEGLTPLLKFIQYKIILSRLPSLSRDDLSSILIFLVKKGSKINDVQLPLRLLYTLLPQIPSTAVKKGVNVTTIDIGSSSPNQTPIGNDLQFGLPTHAGKNLNNLNNLKKHNSSNYINGINSDKGGAIVGGENAGDDDNDDNDNDDDDDDGFFINVKGGGDDLSSLGSKNDSNLGGFNANAPRHNSQSPDHPVNMLPQQYVLNKQVHLMNIYHLLSATFTNASPIITTALHYNSGRLEEVDETFLEVLLLLGADPNHISATEETALRTVCRQISMKKTAIQILLNYRACARYDGSYKITQSPLYLCLQSNCELPIIRALVFRGAQVNRVVNSEPGPLFHAVGVHLQQAKRLGEKDPTVIQFLIQAKANINEVDEDQETVLMKAVRSKGAKLLVQLLANGSNLFFVNNSGKSATDLALAEYAAILK